MASAIDFDPDLFRALAEPTRIEILGVLIAAGGSANVGAVAAQVDVDPSVVSRHLRELVRAGALSVERRGRERWYALQLDHLIDHFTTLTGQLLALKQGLPCC